MQRTTSQFENSTMPAVAVPHDRARARRAFTLVELMVVIGIAAILLSLTLVAVMSAVGTAKIGATKGTIVKVQGLLQQRIDSVIRKEPPDKNTTLYYQSRGFNLEQARAMTRKHIFRQAFPQTWLEMETYYPSLLTGQTYPAAAYRYPATESSEVLYFLLTKANVLGYPPEGQDVFSSAEVRDTDNPPNGAMEIVDAWQRPLRFYRWPTRLIRGGPYAAGAFTPSATARGMIPSLPTTATDLTHDADDKYGLLKFNTNGGNYGLTATELTYFESGGAPMASRFYNVGRLHTPQTMSLPLIVSGGPDLETGLFEPSDTMNFGDMAQPDPGQVSATFDDVTNYNVRSGTR